MKDFVKNNKRVILVCILVTIALLSITVYLSSQIHLDALMFPQGDLSVMATEKPFQFEGDWEFNKSFICPGIPSKIYVPENFSVTKGILSGTYDDMNVLICSDVSGRMSQLLQDEIAEILCPPLLGQQTKVDIMVEETGYLYQYKVSYVGARLSSTVTFSKISCFVLCYEIKITQNDSWYIIVSSEDINRLSDEKDLLDKLANTLEINVYTEEELLEMMEQMKKSIRIESDK